MRDSQREHLGVMFCGSSFSVDSWCRSKRSTNKGYYPENCNNTDCSALHTLVQQQPPNFVATPTRAQVRAGTRSFQDKLHVF